MPYHAVSAFSDEDRMSREQRQQATQLAKLAAEFLRKGGSATLCPPGSAIREPEEKRPAPRKKR